MRDQQAVAGTKVVVEGGMPFGEPAVRPISTTTLVTSDERGNVMVTGEVRSALGSRAAGFVKVIATFAGAGGAIVGTEFSYVQGRTRRGRLSRVIDDSTVGGSESACYVIRTTIPISQCPVCPHSRPGARLNWKPCEAGRRSST